MSSTTMKKLLLVGTVITALLLIVALSSSRSANVVAQEQLSLTVQAVPLKSRYVKMEPIQVDLKVSNQTARSVTWSAFVGLGPSVNLLVRNENGEETKWEGKELMPLVHLGYTPIRLDPGNEYRKTLLLEMNLVEKIFPNSGSYQVRFEFLNDKHTPDLERDSIVSSAFGITIDDPQGEDLDAYRSLTETLRISRSEQDDDERIRLKQRFVDRHPNSTYAKYLIFELASVYEVLGENTKAARELCKVSNEKFYFSDQIQRKLQRIDEKLHPSVPVPLAEDDPVPSKPHPCLWVHK